MGLFDFLKNKTITEQDQESIGWNAIDAAFRKTYGNQKPKHFAPKISYNLGGDEPLEGISIFFNEEKNLFHYVTYGFSELHEKESENLEISGWGFELTFRLSAIDFKNPPLWPINLLQSIAKVVFENGSVFKEYHTIPFEPNSINLDTDISGLLFVNDPEIKNIKTTYGTVNFIQLFGLNESQYNGIVEKRIDRRKFIEEVIINNPLLITSLL